METPKAKSERLLKKFFQQVIVDTYPGKKHSTFHTFEGAMKRGAWPEVKRMAIVSIMELCEENEYWKEVIKEIECF